MGIPLRVIGGLEIQWDNFSQQSATPRFGVGFMPNYGYSGAVERRPAITEESLRDFLAQGLRLPPRIVDDKLKELQQCGTATVDNLELSGDDIVQFWPAQAKLMFGS